MSVWSPRQSRLVIEAGLPEQNVSPSAYESYIDSRVRRIGEKEASDMAQYVELFADHAGGANPLDVSLRRAARAGFDQSRPLLSESAKICECLLESGNSDIVAAAAARLREISEDLTIVLPLDAI